MEAFGCRKLGSRSSTHAAVFEALSKGKPEPAIMLAFLCIRGVSVGADFLTENRHLTNVGFSNTPFYLLQTSRLVD